MSRGLTLAPYLWHAGIFPAIRSRAAPLGTVAPRVQPHTAPCSCSSLCRLQRHAQEGSCRVPCFNGSIIGRHSCLMTLHLPKFSAVCFPVWAGSPLHVLRFAFKWAFAVSCNTLITYKLIRCRRYCCNIIMHSLGVWRVWAWMPVEGCTFAIS